MMTLAQKFIRALALTCIQSFSGFIAEVSRHAGGLSELK
jgi:hypothetical protein